MAEGEANQVLSAAGAAQRRKKSSNKTLVVSVVLLCGVGFGVWRIFFQSGSVNSAGQPQVSSGRTVLPLESFTVNLADREDGRFLRTTLSLGVDGTLPTLTKPESKAVEAGGVSMATIRDSIITVLAQCKSNDLLTPEGKLKLKSDLVSALNRDVPGLQAREVYFTEFLVQR
jgi:flagellar FliL protein